MRAVSKLAAARRRGPDASTARTLSVVVPIHNEAGHIAALTRRVGAVLDRLACEAEILFVDDGSTDDGAERVRAERAIDRRVKLVRLSRNFGKEQALAAGLAFAGGDAVVLIDGDLQHPPELIADLVRLWSQGFDVVYGVRADRRDERPARRWATQLFYRLFGRIGIVPLPDGAGDFRLLDRRVVDVLNALPERTRFSKGLFAWVGFRQTGVPYDVAPRANGRSRFSALKLAAAALDGLTSFSLVPLRLCTALGAAISLVSVAYAFWTVAKTLLYGSDWPGYPSLIVAVLFMGGVQLLSLGIIGEYVGRIFLEVKRRPLFVVADQVGLDARLAATPAAVEPESLSV